jgi:acyl carrier protein
MDELTKSLAQYIAQNHLKVNWQSLHPDQPLLSTGLVDSFNLVDLALYIETSFGVRLENYELNADTFDTLNQLASLIQSRC